MKSHLSRPRELLVAYLKKYDLSHFILPEGKLVLRETELAALLS